MGMITIEVNGKDVDVDDSFKDLSEAEQHNAIDHISSEMKSVEMPEKKTDGVFPAIAGAYGAAAGTGVGGAMYGINKFLNKGAAPSAAPAAKPQEFLKPHEVAQHVIDTAAKQNRPELFGSTTDVYNWSQGKTPDAGQYRESFMGGRDAEQEAALQKQRVAIEGSMPEKSVLPGGSGIIAPKETIEQIRAEKQMENELRQAGVQKGANVAADARAARLKLRDELLSRQLRGENVLGGVASLGKSKAFTGGTAAYNAMDLGQQISAGHTGQAAISGAGLVGSAAASELPLLKSLRPKYKILGAAAAVGAPLINRGIEAIQNRAEGGLVHLAGGGQPEDAPYVGYPQVNRNRQEGYGTGYLNTLATAIDPTGLTAAIPEANASVLSETPKERSYREGKEAAQPIAEVISNLQMLNFGKQLAKPALKYAIPKAMKTVEQLKHLNTPHGYAGGKRVIAEEALDLAKKASGYLHHTPVNPNPLVGTRFETKDLGGLAPIKDISLEDIRDHMLQTKPWDTSSRNKQIVSVSGKPITADIVTHGGQSYPRDLEHIKQEIGGASALPITNRIQNITNIASHEGEKLGGTGQVSMTPSSMSKFSEDYAVPTFDTYKNLWDQAEPGAARTQAFLEKLRFASPKTLKTETPIPFAGMVKDVKYPFQDLKSLDFNDPDVAGRFMQTPDLRKAAIKEWRSKENQKMMGYNAEDLSAAHTDPNLMGVPAGYAGHTMIEMKPGATPTLSSNITYDTDFGGNYLGSIGHTPTAVLLNKSYSKINNEMRQLHPDANEDALHRLTLGALYTRNHGVSDLVNDEMINRVGAYHEGVKQNKIDPNDVQGALQYLSKPGAYNEGGSIKGYQAGKLVKAASNFILPAAENAARTQIIGTLPTYGKAAEMLAQRGASGQAIDFGAGLGKGADLLGPGTHTYEPFAQGWNPTYSNASDIPSDAYNRLTNLNVLNVVPREARDEIVQHIGRVMEPGGQGIITTRGADVMKAQGRPGPEPTSVITSRDTYQKGFSKQELEDYLKYMLGQGYDINKINLGPAGVHIQKKAEGGLVYLAEGGQPNMQAYAPGASRGIAPYGFRHVENVSDVSLPKGTGWMGALPNQTGGISTEISADSNGSQYPLINPNMNHQDINSLLANQQPTDEMYRKAEQWAKYRQAQGKGPFISPVGELKQPLPKP